MAACSPNARKTQGTKDITLTSTFIIVSSTHIGASSPVIVKHINVTDSATLGCRNSSVLRKATRAYIPVFAAAANGVGLVLIAPRLYFMPIIHSYLQVQLSVSLEKKGKNGTLQVKGGV